MALDAADLLRSHGFKAVRLEEGLLDWKERGLEVEVAGEVQ